MQFSKICGYYVTSNKQQATSNKLKTKRTLLITIACIFCMTGLSQTFANTHSGTVGKRRAPAGWTKISSPEYSSTTENGLDLSTTSWTATLPVSPSGATTFPVPRVAEAITQNITDLTPGEGYEIEVSYLYPTATGRYGPLYTGSPPTPTAYVAIGGTKTHLPIGNANVWYTTTVKFTAAASSETLELGMEIGPDQYATAFDVGPNAVQLPVDLIAFTAEPLGNKDALLHWTTASEINNSHFDVERSYDGRTFEAIGKVAGNGNSQHQIEYSFTDAFVSKVQNTVYYRFKQVDFDGAYEYSDIRVVRFDAVGNDMQLVAYPNPMNDELNVMLSLPSGEKYQLQVTNLQGALVHQKNHVFSSGLHTLDLSQWNSGMYIVEVISERGSEHIKVMKK